MITAIQHLRQEHHNLLQLLEVLERQLDAIRREWTPDYYLMCNILHYLVEHPDHYHHPYEDLVYDRLVSRAPSMATLIEHFLDEHTRLADLGRQSLTLVERVLDDDIVTRADVYASGSSYLHEYRAHIQRENAEFLAAADTHLTATDWKQIEAIFYQRPDPLFGPEIAAEYKALHDCISIETAQRETNQAGEECCSACSTT
ncbi:MAG TPA: hemerythrin domain-containing protein [Nitrococcus sp.]|nr:hemerythrin domain-containing protein [Nitrococcus sp.]